jgi:hypothetical protein
VRELRDFGGGVSDVHGDGSFVVDFDWLPGTCSFGVGFSKEAYAKICFFGLWSGYWLMA